MSATLNSPHGIPHPITSFTGQVAGYDEIVITDTDASNSIIADTSNNLKAALGDMTALLFTLQSGAHVDEKARRIHNLIDFSINTDGGINNNAINEASVVSISNFTDPIVNGISGSSATFDITRLGTIATVNNGKLQGELEVTAGSATQWEQILFWECEINTVSNTSTIPFIKLHRRGTTTEHDIFELKKESSGNGMKLYVREGSNLQNSVALTVANIKRPGDPYFSAPSRRGVPTIPNPAVPGTQMENRTFPHFEVGQTVRGLVKFEAVDPDNVATTKLQFRVMLAVYDSNGNWIRTLDMELTTPDAAAPDVADFDYNQFFFVPGDSSGLHATPFTAIEMYQYVAGNNAGNEIHFPEDAGNRIIQTIDETHRLLGYYEATLTDVMNIHTEVKANSFDTAGSYKINGTALSATDVDALPDFTFDVMASNHADIENNAYVVQPEDHGQLIAINPGSTCIFVILPQSLYNTDYNFKCGVYLDAAPNGLVRVACPHIIGRPASINDNADKFIKQGGTRVANSVSSYSTVSGIRGAVDVDENYSGYDFLDLWHPRDWVELNMVNTGGWCGVKINNLERNNMPQNPTTGQTVGFTSQSFSAALTSPTRTIAVTKFRLDWVT